MAATFEKGAKTERQKELTGAVSGVTTTGADGTTAGADGTTCGTMAAKARFSQKIATKTAQRTTGRRADERMAIMRRLNELLRVVG